MELYYYQTKTINSIRQKMREGYKRLLMVAPTGAGKTVMFSYMVNEAISRGKLVLVLTHRSELLLQAGGAFNGLGLFPDFISQKSKPNTNHTLHIAMIETLNSRIKSLEPLIKSKDLIIIDECHLNTFTKLFKYFNDDAYVLGVTATPVTLNKENHLFKLYQTLVSEIDTPELVDRGFLTKPKHFSSDVDLKGIQKKGNEYDMSDYYSRNKTYIGVVSNYKEICNEKKAIIFSANIEASKDVMRQFIDNGYPCKHIDGSTTDKERLEVLSWFKYTPNAVLCNCGLLTAGFDEPSIECVILYRATLSLALYLQMIGRGSRKHSGKEFFYILDFGENVKRFGRWNDSRVWTLEEKQKTPKVAPVKNCPKCDYLMHTTINVCPHCGYIFPEKPKTKEEIKLKLIEDNVQIYPRLNFFLKKVTEEGWKPFRVLHVLNDYNEAVAFCQCMGYKPNFPYMNKDRFKVFKNHFDKKKEVESA